jgi:hypothetical protein
MERPAASLVGAAMSKHTRLTQAGHAPPNLGSAISPVNMYAATFHTKSSTDVYNTAQAMISLKYVAINFND